MVTSKSKSGQKKGKVKVGKLKLNRETVKDLSASERKGVKGGLDRLIIPGPVGPGGPVLPVIRSANNQCRYTDGPTCGAP